MKRYLVFAGIDCYPGGGFNDFIESFESKQEALAKVENMVGMDAPDNIDTSFYCEWGQVVDQETEEKWYYETFGKDGLEYSWECSRGE